MQEQSKYIELSEAARELNVVRGTVYHYVKTLDIETKKFPLDRHSYIAREDYSKIVAAKQAAAAKSH